MRAADYMNRGPNGEPPSEELPDLIEPEALPAIPGGANQPEVVPIPKS
jgi:hypothetical protein